jgi:hypothetical protein
MSRVRWRARVPELFEVENARGGEGFEKARHYSR